MTISGSLRKIGGSLATLYRAVPRDFKSLAALHRQKAALVKEAGVHGLLYDLARNTISLIDFTRHVIFSRGPKPAVFSPYTWNIEDVRTSYPLSKYLPDTLALEIAKYIPPMTIPLTLVDKKHSYTCYQVAITPENQGKTEKARQLVAEALTRYGYEGWSDEIDHSYDRTSFYFIVEDKAGEIVATTRLINRVPGMVVPLEVGDRPDGAHYSLEHETKKIADINSFFYKRGEARALIPLFSALARYGALTGVDRAYCMLDINNEKIKQMYLRAGFRFSPRYTEPISFPTFGKTTPDGFVPTPWTIMAMGRPAILKMALNSLRYTLT
jgi:hypothetical protein